MRLEEWISEDLAEVEREELARQLRRERRIAVALMVVYAASILVEIVTIVWIFYRAATAETRDRAAYNEGYYGVDSRTAMALAEAGVGKSARDILGGAR